MRSLKRLFDNNRKWAGDLKARDPRFFSRLTEQQTPKFLWIGCSDSRVPANDIVGLLPGELFVHRNVANQVVHTDLNMLTVIFYAVQKLRARHIIVCGHYGCGGVQAAARDARLGLIDNWLRHVQDVASKHRVALGALAEESQRLARLCELNVMEQVLHVCETTIVQGAWERGRKVEVHGWIYDLADGLLKDLDVRAGSAEELMAVRVRVDALK